MANITTDNLKAIVQSVIASATRHKPNLSVTDPDDPRFVVGAKEVAKNVQNAQATADNAQATADKAQATADKAQATADKTQVTKRMTVIFEFDKQTEGRDTFKWNGFAYYKVSDFCPRNDQVSAFTGTDALGNPRVKTTIGTNATEYGLWIVVTKAGWCSLPVSEQTTYSFKAPSPGLYAMHAENALLPEAYIAGTADFDVAIVALKCGGKAPGIPPCALVVDETKQLVLVDEDLNETAVGDTMTLSSTTPGSSKRFRLTVDDEGTIKAEEVTA